jgi:hypothetical protein
MDAEVTMPGPMSVFLDFGGDEESLVTVLAEILGFPLTREDGDVGTLYRCRVLDTEVVMFGNHGLEDDCGIRFSTFTFQLELRPFEIGLRVASYQSMYEGMALFLAERLSTRLECEAQVVANLQRLVATFAAGSPGVAPPVA